MIIDAHQHFWQLSQPFEYGWLDAPQNAPIRKDLLPADLEPKLQALGIDRSIFVQTQHDVSENRWALNYCDHYDFLAGIVGWVDLASPDCEEQLEEFRENPRFLGVRHVTQDEPDDDFIIRPEVIRGLQVLENHSVPFDLLFYVKHLPHAETVARQVPDLPLVIDHLAKPRVREQSIEDWLPAFKQAAECDNVYCKLSGMITEADWQNWKKEDLRPYVDQALELFGPDRCMYGSDWPVCELAGSYEQVYLTLRDLLSELSEAEQSKIFGGTAAKFYGVEETSGGGPTPP